MAAKKTTTTNLLGRRARITIHMTDALIAERLERRKSDPYSDIPRGFEWEHLGETGEITGYHTDKDGTPMVALVLENGEAGNAYLSLLTIFPKVVEPKHGFITLTREDNESSTYSVNPDHIAELERCNVKPYTWVTIPGHQDAVKVKETVAQILALIAKARS